MTFKYAGPAVLTIDGGMEWTVEADLATDQEQDVQGAILPMLSWGGTLKGGDRAMYRALGVAALVRLPDGRQGALYCVRHSLIEKTDFGRRVPAHLAITLEVVGSGPAPY